MQNENQISPPKKLLVLRPTCLWVNRNMNNYENRGTILENEIVEKMECDKLDSRFTAVRVFGEKSTLTGYIISADLKEIK